MKNHSTPHKKGHFFDVVFVLQVCINHVELNVFKHNIMGKEESPCLKVKQFKEIALKKFNFVHCVNSVLACKSDEFQ